MLQDTIVKVVVIFSGLANLFLAIYVYKKNSKDNINKNFLYFGLAIFLWCLVNFIMLFEKNIFWFRVTYSIGTIVTLTGLYFTLALCNTKINKWLQIFLSLVCSVFFVLIIFTPLLFENLVSFTSTAIAPVSGPLFYIWTAYMVFLIGTTLSVPFIFIKKVDEERKKQILYFLLGEAIFGIWAVLVIIVLPSLGVNQFSNLDTPATIFVVGFTSYAIVKYHLMGIRSVLFKAFIYALVIIILIALLLALMSVGSYLFTHEMIWPICVVAILLSIALFFVGRLFFVEKRDLEKAKINLTEMLEQSENNRMKVETERDKTATIIKSFSDGLIILDEHDEIFLINPEAEKILELKINGLIKKPIQSLSVFSKAIPIVSALKTGLTNILKKELILDKDLTIELSVIPLNLNEKDIGHLIVIHDISREKTVEKMKTEFVSLAAHQLRTPISIMNWSMSMLKNGDFGKLNKKQKEIVESAFKTNEGLIVLVSDLLNTTRIEEGAYLHETTMTDMKKIVDSVLDNYKDAIKKRKIKIEYFEPKNFPQAKIDEKKIKLAVQNLIDNAIKYSPEGGKIVITLKNDNKNIVFKIQDSGIGIPKNQQNKIFAKFFRSDNAKKIDPNGSGLGLFLTENIINAHGGKIWFESKENVGTSFYFTLPI